MSLPTSIANNDQAELKRKLRRRELAASWRDTWLLLREFRWPLIAFFLTVVGGGTLYYVLAQAAGEPLDNLLEAYYQVLSMIFMQSSGEFPRSWYLEIFYFIMPVIGVIILAQGVAEFGVMLFNRRERGKEWEMAVASMMNQHVILIGLGHLGYRVARSLHDMGHEVVAIELNPSAHLVASVKEIGIPVIEDDASRDTALEAAGIRKAQSIILCTQNDSLNLQVALKARRIRPNIPVIVRIFDDEFAQELHEQFGFLAFSATGMAAPAFAAAAVGLEMTRPISLEGETLSLGRLKVLPRSQLINLSVKEVEQRYNVSVVLLQRNHESDLHPPAECVLMEEDGLAVLGGPSEISLLAQINGPFI
ncbi:MAG TPA: NAD-binding protein [Anaerolineales bacterium]|nr:NAD-binding protein [Anaerolineales bacterium]